MKLLETYVEISVQANKLEMGLKNARKTARQRAREINQEFAILDFKNPLRQLSTMNKLILSMGVGYGLKNLAMGFLNTASELQNLRIGLDTITKGRGEEWFRKINEWAIRMPISTKQAIQSFTQLTAMGLMPTIEQMQILLDTTSALGGGSEVLAGIGLAIGQIYTKGKLESQEIRQLAERGVPAYDILSKKLGVTAAEMERVGHATIKSKAALDALFAGMAERFGGQSSKIMTKWLGLVEQMRGYWTEFQRQVMNSGVLQYLESELGKVVKKIDAMFASGEFTQRARQAADMIKAFLNRTIELAKFVYSNRNLIGQIFAVSTMAIVINMIAKQITIIYELITALKALGSTAIVAAILANPATIPTLAISGAALVSGLAAFSVFKGKESMYGTEYYGDVNKYLQKPSKTPSTGFGKTIVGNAIYGNAPIDLTVQKNQLNEITKLTEEQEKALYEIKRDYEDARISLIQNSFDRERAEILQWYSEQQKMLKDNKATKETYGWLDKTKDMKISAINVAEAIARQTKAQDEAMAALNERKDADIKANDEAIQRAKDEANKVVDLRQYIKEQTIKLTTDDYTQQKALAEAQYLWDYQKAVEQYGAKSEVLKAMEEAHNLDMQNLAKENTDRINQETLSFANYWGNMLTSVVEQSGNTFNNIGRMFEQMVKKMMIKAAAMQVFNVLFSAISGKPALSFGTILTSVFKGMATGGTVEKSNPYIVGERGAELFVPQSSGKIIPNDVFQSIRNAKSKPTNVITDNSTVNIQITGAEIEKMSKQELVNKIEEAVRETRLKEVIKKAVNG